MDQLFVSHSESSKEILECIGVALDVFHKWLYTQSTTETINYEAYIKQCMPSLSKEKATLFIKFLQQLESSTPFANWRYQGHMNYDISIPHYIGTIVGMLYNQNLVALESSYSTTILEKSLVARYATILGYNQDTSWGHLTSGGTAGNIESLWYARNIRYFPLSVAKAKINTTFKNVHLDTASDFTLMNSFTTEDIINMYQAIRTSVDDMQKEHNESDWEKVKQHDIRSIGIAAYNTKPIVIVSEASHYSIEKLMDVLGFGGNALQKIAINSDDTMNIASFELTIKMCKQHGHPIVAVIVNIGTTELGVVDDLESILYLLNKHSIKTHIHADAAWGGYFAYLFGVPTSYTTSSSAYLKRQFASLKYCDSISLDPHKAGYAPYQCGFVMYKTMAKGLVSYAASYINPGASTEDMCTAAITLDGTRSGAMVAGLYYAHNYITDKRYCELMYNMCMGAQKLTTDLAQVWPNVKYEVYPLLSHPQLAINVFIVNEKGNTNIHHMHDIMKGLTNKLTMQIGQTKIGNRLIFAGCGVELNYERRRFLIDTVGIDPDSINGIHELPGLRCVVMDPDMIDDTYRGNFVKEFHEILQTTFS